MRLVDGGWGKEFADALSVNASELRIICPFIKLGALESLLTHQPSKVQVITRFNLADFAEGVSDVAALRKLLDCGANVRGVRNLHAKLYIFGESRAMITSANLTSAALDRNHEFGLITEEASTISKCLAYFDSLWQRASNDLLLGQVDAWDKTVTNYWVSGGRPNATAGLDDFGADAGIVGPPNVQMPTIVSEPSQAFVKFQGSAKNRIQLSATTIDEIDGSGCHWAVCYPSKRGLNRVRDGAVIFIGRLTRNRNDIRVFGRAIGMEYQPGRDDASLADIELREWKARWSRYIRVHHAEFVDGAMENGISLNELMDTLGANSFASTERNAASGKGNTNPRFAYRQQASVELSNKGFEWLAGRLQQAFETYGTVSRNSLDKLDWPDPSIIPA